MGRVKVKTKRRTKAEAEVLDHATNNLLRAFKRDIQKEEGSVDVERLREDGYSDRLPARPGECKPHSFFRNRKPPQYRAQ